MDGQTLRRKDTTKGPPLRILSLDGGGVRGYSMLIILQELMYRSYVEIHNRAPKREEIPKPCDLFDLIGGTGTGGLIAIMLGRLRMDIETCMDVYVRMTRKVFETDKTIAGIPYKSTLFKASKLEEAIRACVREHTIFDDEGNDGTATGGKEFQGMSPVSVAPRRAASVRSTSTTGLASPLSTRNSMVSPAMALQWGNPDASLYDGRENRTKTAVTAVYQGTPLNGSSVLLRSYDSRKESAPEYNCTIWEAGRATSATGLAFKPIKIGQSTFIDEGAGKYNPAPLLLEEAAVNEWPGREIGVFVSIGTGKRPAGTNANKHEWWEGFVGGSVGSFAEARRRLISKIEGCEDVHIQMLNTELAKRGVAREAYVRLNVEVGVGDFGMNEWDRLGEMNTSTRRYLRKDDVQELIYGAAVQIAKVELMKTRLADREQGGRRRERSYDSQKDHLPTASTVSPMPGSAVELPAGDVPVFSPQHGHQHHNSNPPYPIYPAHTTSQDKFMIVPEQALTPRVSAELPIRSSTDRLSHQISDQKLSPSRRSADGGFVGGEPPPRPPKTPINDPGRPMSLAGRTNGHPRPPYPDTDGPPPVVNKLKKPEFSAR